MGTIIRITGDGVFIESSPKNSSMESCSSDLSDREMCNPSMEIGKIIDVTDFQHPNAFKHEISGVKSSEMNCIGQCYCRL